MLNVIMQKDKLYIGDSPVLVDDPKTQKNYIHCEKEDIPFKKEIRLSPDLLQGKRPRVCLKNHSCNLHAPLCGIFHPNSVVVARYDALIRAKSPTNCDAHLAESLFQTRSKVLNMALNYYYQTACEIAEEMRIAREYGKRANRTVAVRSKDL